MSSSHKRNHEAKVSALPNKFWIPEQSAQGEWLQVFLRRTRLIKAVQVIGSEAGFVSEFLLSCSLDDKTFATFRKSDGSFYAAFTQDSADGAIIDFWLQACLYVRLTVTKWQRQIAVNWKIFEAVGMSRSNEVCTCFHKTMI